MESINSTIEKHPWLRFPNEDNNAHSLILGSFPPLKFTLNLHDKTKCDVDFFYGSKDNSFWDLFIQAKNLAVKWPDDEEKLKNWLKYNGWIISDIILKANRKNGSSASDSDLKDIEWNIKIIKDILLNNPVKNIFFTSRFVKDNFFEKIHPSIKSKVNKKQCVTLISPSPSGLRRIDWSYDHLKKKKDESLTEFRKRYYSKFLS